jgi:NADH-quinone oxidoreductase subunit C/D
MFNWKEFEKIEQILSHMGGENYRIEWGQHHLHVRPNDLLDWMEFLKDDLDFFTVAEIAGRDAGDLQREVVYHLLNMGLHQRLNLHLLVKAGEVIPSVVAFFPHADWPEREQAEIFNLTFDRERKALILPEHKESYPFKKWPQHKPSVLPKLRFNPNKSEAPYAEEKYQWKKFDILSPMTLGDFEWNVCFDPERVVESFIQIGFHHQGLERLLENKDIFQILQLVDRVNLSSAPNYSIAWSRTIEEMFRIKIPERAQAIRIVMLELARIADHLSVLHAICCASGQDEYRHFLNAREKVYELFEKFSGHRHGLGSSRLGGVKEDLPHGWIVEYQNVSEVLSKNLVLIHNSLLSQPKFREMLAGESVNAQAVLQWGVSGPAMRAAGLNFDLRKSQPFYFYRDIDFDIPVGINGAAYDRYLIRYEEIFQSLRIITQVIDNLPLGEVVPVDFDKNYLELSQMFATLEHPPEWHYSSLESPAGEAGFLVNLAKDLRPSRIKLKTPGFCLAAALPIFIKGLREDQLPPSLASLGLCRWEMDR